MTFLSDLIAATGRDPSSVRRGTFLAEVLRRHGVRDTAELRRVVAIPPRDPWWLGPDGEVAADMMTERLRAPGGTMRLRPVQAAALMELHDHRGLLAPIPVGGGKTLVSLLAGTVMLARQPALLLPAKLRDKTWRDRDALAPHWRITDPLVLSYETLGRADHAEDLDRAAPDLVVADEAHRLRNARAAVTRRVRRYLARGGVVFAAMSGTLTRKGLVDLGHLAAWSLGGLSPVPRPWPDLDEWARAVDPDRDEDRVTVGALTALMTDAEREDPDHVGAARRALGRRVRTCPGVVSLPDDRGCPASIRLRVRRPRRPEVLRALARLRASWETPSGEPLALAAEVWAKARQLALGFHYRWREPPPEAWLRARRAWAAFVREVVSRSRHVDSELQVMREHADAPEARAWVEVRDTFRPATVAEWYTLGPLEDAAAWLAEGPGLAWVGHVAFGEALARRAGCGYFHEGGRDAEGRAADAPDAGDRAVVSIGTCSEGLNLQRWSRNLVLAPPSLSAEWEQMIGRTHRPGQEADEVTVDVLDAGGEVERARERAAFERDTMGLERKLLIADVEEE